MKNIIKTFTIGAFLFSTALIPLSAQPGMVNKSPMYKNSKINQDYKNYTPEEKAAFDTKEKLVNEMDMMFKIMTSKAA